MRLLPSIDSEMLYKKAGLNLFPKLHKNVTLPELKRNKDTVFFYHFCGIFQEKPFSWVTRRRLLLVFSSRSRLDQAQSVNFRKKLNFL